jgi:hypothetical protein
MSVYALQRAGFPVQKASSTDLAALPQTNISGLLSDAVEPVTKSLSSITPLTSQPHSQPSFSLAPNPGYCQNESLFPHISQSPSLYRSESLPVHKQSCQELNTPLENVPRVASNGLDEFNPYKVFYRLEKPQNYPITMDSPSIVPLNDSGDYVRTPATSFVSPTTSAEYESRHNTSSMQNSVEGNQGSRASTAETKTRKSSENLHEKESVNFRDLMPLPRDLPFPRPGKRSKSSTLTSKPNGAPEKTSGKEPKTSMGKEATQNRAVRLSAKYTDRGTNPELLRGTPSRKILTPQLRLRKGTRNQSTTPVSKINKPANLTSDAMLVLTEPGTLSNINEKTSKLLDQYERDTTTGCDELACAQFYSDQIHALRFDFWYSKISEMGGFAEENSRAACVMV